MCAGLPPRTFDGNMNPFNYIDGLTVGTDSLLHIQSIGDVLGIIINVLMGSGFAISLACIGYSAIQYALSAGDPKAAQTAWHSFIWGVIAAAVSLGALVIKLAIARTIGVTSTDITNELPSF